MDQPLRPMDVLRQELIEKTGLENVYIDPPESIRMKYPCIRVSLSSAYTQYANNFSYRHTPSYNVMLIDYDPDSEYYNNLVEGFQMIRFNRHYVADDLHHYDFILYYKKHKEN